MQRQRALLFTLFPFASSSQDMFLIMMNSPRNSGRKRFDMEALYKGLCNLSVSSCNSPPLSSSLDDNLLRLAPHA